MRVAVIGQMIEALATCTSVRIVNYCVVLAVLGISIGMSDNGDGDVTNVAVEHGSLISTE